MRSATPPCGGGLSPKHLGLPDFLTPPRAWARSRLSMEVAAVQRRTLRLLFVTQIISGIGVAVGASVGALLAAELAGVSVSGLAQSAVVVGAALFAIPATA